MASDSVLCVFLLALAVERVTAFARVRNWQPLKAFRSTKVDLTIARESSAISNATDPWAPAIDLRARKRLVRDVLSENTIVIGIALAFLTGSDAFGSLRSTQVIADSLLSASREALQSDRALKLLLTILRITVTGLAAAAIATLWHELHTALADWRRALRQQPQSTALSREPGGEGPLEELKESARRRIPELLAISGVESVSVAFAIGAEPEHPGVEFHVVAQTSKKPPVPGTLVVSSSTGEVHVPVVVIA